MSNATAAPFLSQRYWVLGVILAYLLLVVAFRWTDVQELHTHWTTPGDLDFGYLLLAGGLYFCWRNMAGAAVGSPAWVLLLGFVGLCALHWLATVTATKSIRLIATALSLWFLVGGVFGWAVARRMLLPIALLWVATPAWFLLIAPLQAMSVAVNTFACNLTGITVFISDNYFHLSGGVVEIARGCAGLKYMQTFMALAIANLCLQQEHRWFYIIRSLAIAALAALIVNWIRIFVLINVAEYYGIDHPLMADHDMLGWMLFVPAVLAYFYFSGQEEDAEAAPAEAGSGSSLAIRRYLVPAAVACLALIFFALSARVGNYEGDPQELSIGGAAADAPCRGLAAYAGRGFLAPQAQVTGCYRLSGAGRDIPVAAEFFSYAQDYQNSKLISSSNHFIDPGLGPQSAVFNADALSLPQSLGAQTLALPDGSGTLLVLFGYQLGDRFLVSDVRAKLASTQDRLLGYPTPRGAWRIAIPCGHTSCNQLGSEVGELVSQILAEVPAKLVDPK